MRNDRKLLCEMTLKGLVGSGSKNGMYKTWTTCQKDDKHRQDCRAFDIFPEFTADDDSSPPWRLSPQELALCDRRVLSMWWPHYMDPVAFEGHSFWTHSDRIWKCRHKAFVFCVILPTCLHQCVPAVHTAILIIASALRGLAGQVYCDHETTRRGFVPGVV